MVKVVKVWFDDDVWEDIWKIVKAIHTNPTRKFSLTVNELLRKVIPEEKKKLGLE